MLLCFEYINMDTKRIVYDRDFDAIAEIIERDLGKLVVGYNLNIRLTHVRMTEEECEAAMLNDHKLIE